MPSIACIPNDMYKRYLKSTCNQSTGGRFMTLILKVSCILLFAIVDILDIFISGNAPGVGRPFGP